MLASPGHSPRHILPSPSPSPSIQSLDGGNGRALVPSGKGLMGPPPAKKPKRAQNVVDEDTYVAAIEKIIERDFFPDIPKLQNRLEWLEAVRSGDPVIMREAQLNIIQRRQEKARERALVDGVTPMTNRTAGTPSSIRSMAPSLSFASPSQASVSEVPVLNIGDETNPVIDTNVSLDEFLRRHTSEDNDSFSKLIEKVNKQRKEKFRFLTEGGVSAQLRLTQGEDRVTDGFGTSGQPESTLEGWDYRAKNLLMYDSAEREDAPLTEAEKEEKLHGPPKKVNIRNTRFHGKMFDSKLQDEDPISILYTPVHGSTPFRDRDSGRKRYDLEDLRQTPQVADANLRSGTSGYSFVHTPSPAPGVDESPFITWGEIDGTPLRLEVEDTPVGIGGNGDGPHFKIPAPPSRDARAHSLSREAARSLREKSRLHQAISSPAPGSASPGMGALSAAAQRFVNKAMAKSCASVDAKLRASYGASTTPGTPRMARNAVRSRDGSVGLREGSVGRSPSVRESSVLRSPSPAGV